MRKNVNTATKEHLTTGQLLSVHLGQIRVLVLVVDMVDTLSTAETRRLLFVSGDFDSRRVGSGVGRLGEEGCAMGLLDRRRGGSGVGRLGEGDHALGLLGSRLG